MFKDIIIFQFKNNLKKIKIVSNVKNKTFIFFKINAVNIKISKLILVSCLLVHINFVISG